MNSHGNRSGDFPSVNCNGSISCCIAKFSGCGRPYQLSLDEFRGLYISDEQVDALVDRDREAQGLSPTVAELSQRAAGLYEVCRTALRPAHSPWVRLAAEFTLSPEEQDILLLRFSA